MHNLVVSTKSILLLCSITYEKPTWLPRSNEKVLDCEIGFQDLEKVLNLAKI